MKEKASQRGGGPEAFMQIEVKACWQLGSLEAPLAVLGSGGGVQDLLKGSVSPRCSFGCEFGGLSPPQYRRLRELSERSTKPGKGDWGRRGTLTSCPTQGSADAAIARSPAPVCLCARRSARRSPGSHLGQAPGPERGGDWQALLRFELRDCQAQGKVPPRRRGGA